jgi:hypothetical protein
MSKRDRVTVITKDKLVPRNPQRLKFRVHSISEGSNHAYIGEHGNRKFVEIPRLKVWLVPVTGIGAFELSIAPEAASDFKPGTEVLVDVTV